MASGFVSTVFEPAASCVAPSNLWLHSTECYKLPFSNYEEIPCTYTFQGDPSTSQLTPTANPCYPIYDKTTAYTDCPKGYTGALTTSYRSYGYIEALTYCCPSAYSYTWDFEPFTTTIDGEVATITWNDQPDCKATSVDVLISQIVTVTLATEPDIATTTIDWAADAVLFAEAVTQRAYVFTHPDSPSPSTCWGARCPMSYEPSPTFPASITPAPSMQFSAPSECLDPGNLWIVYTSCYLTASTQVMESTPDWLTCSVTHFGAPGWNDASCYMPYTAFTIQDSIKTFYEGCPSGYSAVATLSGPGYNTYRFSLGSYDITYFTTGCCPTNFEFASGDVIKTETVHEGMTWGLFVYPPPRCYATSIEALSGQQVPLHTTTNDMVWDKKKRALPAARAVVPNGVGRRQEDFQTTVDWNFEDGTVYAKLEQIGNTVFMGTHTCYEDCSSWFSYYYPDETGAPFTGDQWASLTASRLSSETGGAPAAGTGSAGSTGSSGNARQSGGATTGTGGGSTLPQAGGANKMGVWSQLSVGGVSIVICTIFLL